MLAVHSTLPSEQLYYCQAQNIVLKTIKKSDRSRTIEDFELGDTNPSPPMAQFVFVKL